MFIDDDGDNVTTGSPAQSGELSGNAAESQGSESQGSESQGLENAGGGNGKDTGGEEARIPITDEMRQKLNIPEKFKYLDDVVKWGSNAEKRMSKAEQERAKLEKRNEDSERVIAEMEASLQKSEDKGEITPEEKERIVEQFQIDFAKDPINTMNKLFNAFEKRLSDRKERETFEQQWAKEDDDFRKEYGDDWDNRIREEVIRIASKRPYLRSVEEAVAIYERQKSQKTNINKRESEEKRTQKQRAFSETAGGTPLKETDIYDKIAKAKTIAELEEASKGIPKTERSQ